MNEEMTETLNTLTEQLRHPEKSVRSQAVFELSKLQNANTLPILLDALVNEPDVMVREDITWTLVRMRDESLMPLIDLLRHENSAARHHAAHVLGKIADARAVDALIGVLEDSDPAVISKAVFALRQIDDVRLVGHENREVQSMISSVLEHFGDEALPLLVEKLADASPQVREQAADSLGLIGNRQAVPALARALQDEAWQVRFAAVTALGHIGSVDARKALEQVQNDPDSRVQNLVPKVLWRMRYPSRRKASGL
jgi:HEAT repeat protein